jgi:uncharacterized membrane protein
MKRFKMIISVILMIASLVILFDKLFAPQPIQIVLETGQEVTSQTPDYYSLSEVLLLITSSFIIGSTALYLFYNSDKITSTLTMPKECKSSHNNPEKYSLIIPLLKKNEKMIFSALRDSNGEMLQNKLVAKTCIGKVAVTRALSKLEMKNLIVRERYGLTNKIKLK